MPSVIRRIGELVEEEHALERAVGAGGPDDDTDERLADLEVALDQCWDLLRQRRRRHKGGTPARPPSAPGRRRALPARSPQRSAPRTARYAEGRSGIVGPGRLASLA